MVFQRYAMLPSKRFPDQTMQVPAQTLIAGLGVILRFAFQFTSSSLDANRKPKSVRNSRLHLDREQIALLTGPPE